MTIQTWTAADRPLLRWAAGATWPRVARRELATTLALVLVAFAVYVWRLDAVPAYVYDEVYHAFTAAQLAAGNADAWLWDKKPDESLQGAQRVAYEWVHPALAKPFMQIGVLLFGNQPFGWRIASAVFGALGVGLVFLLGRAYLGYRAGLIAASLLLLDGLWFVQSRIAMNDVFVVDFLLLAYLAFFFYLRGSDRGRLTRLWWVGGALGLAVATKWSGVYSLGMLALLAFAREAWLLRRGSTPHPWRVLATLIGAFVVLPALLYVGGYAQFFVMGHTPIQWVELQRQIWTYHSNLAACHDWSSPGWTWPWLLRPVWYSVQRFGDGSVAHVFALGNPVIWWLSLSALTLVAFGWLRSRATDVAAGLIVLGFVTQWLPWLLSPRIAYLYHMLPSLPFACLALAYVLHKSPRSGLVAAVYLGLALVSFMFFYSHYAAVPVSAAMDAAHYWLPTWAPGSEWSFGCPTRGG